MGGPEGPPKVRYRDLGIHGSVGSAGESPVLNDHAIHKGDVLQSGAAIEGTLADEVHILQVDGGQRLTILRHSCGSPRYLRPE